MFTETYIEMVTQADEIQELWKQKVGDWVVDYNYMIPMLLDKKIEGLNKPVTVIGWLPTLEQLFGILNNQYPVGIFIIIKEFNVWLEDRTLRKAYKDLKDYFLDYIMEILYNKSWNGKEWEEIR